MIMAVLGALLIGPPGPAGAEPAPATDPVRAILILEQDAALADVSAAVSDRAAKAGSAERRRLDQRRTAVRTQQDAVVAAARKAGIAWSSGAPWSTWSTPSRSTSLRPSSRPWPPGPAWPPC